VRKHNIIPCQCIRKFIEPLAAQGHYAGKPAHIEKEIDAFVQKENTQCNPDNIYPARMMVFPPIRQSKKDIHKTMFRSETILRKIQKRTGELLLQ
jgi:hypothetical protein